MNLDVTWRKFTLEHVHSDDVDDHDPDGTLQEVLLVFNEGDDADTLGLKFGTVRVLSPHLSFDILVELVHVEEL